MADILLSQEVAKILVGDPHQQIYGFRGATNAMAQVEATHVYYLTQVYNYGLLPQCIYPETIMLLLGLVVRSPFSLTCEQ